MELPEARRLQRMHQGSDGQRPLLFRVSLSMRALVTVDQTPEE